MSDDTESVPPRGGGGQGGEEAGQLGWQDYLTLTALILTELSIGLATVQPLVTSNLGPFVYFILIGNSAVLATKLYTTITEMQAAKAEEAAQGGAPEEEEMNEEDKRGLADNIADLVKAFMLIGTSIAALTLFAGAYDSVCLYDTTSNLCVYYDNKNTTIAEMCDFNDCFIAQNETLSATNPGFNETVCLVGYMKGSGNNFIVPKCSLFMRYKEMDQQCQTEESNCLYVYKYTLS